MENEKFIEVLKFPCTSQTISQRDSAATQTLRDFVGCNEAQSPTAAQLLAHFGAAATRAAQLPKKGFGVAQRSLVSQVQISGGTSHSKAALEIIARFELLKILDDKRLNRYLDIQQTSQTELLLICQNHIPSPPLVTLKDFITRYKVPFSLKSTKRRPDEEWTALLKKLSAELVSALITLHEQGIVCRNMSVENVYLSLETSDTGVPKLNHVTLYNYGWYYLSGGGLDVPFMIGSPLFLPPEVYDAALPGDGCGCRTADTWALGMCLLSLFTADSSPAHWALNRTVEQDVELPELIDCVLDFDWCQGLASVGETISSMATPQFLDFLQLCLCQSPESRPQPEALRRHPWVSDLFADRESAGSLSFETGINNAQAYYLWKTQYSGQLEFALQTEGVELCYSKILAAPQALPLCKNRRSSFYTTNHLSFLPFDCSPYRISLANIRQKILIKTLSAPVKETSPVSVGNFEQERLARPPEHDPPPYVDKLAMLSSQGLQWAWRTADSQLSSSCSMRKETNMSFQNLRILIFNKLLPEYPANLSELQAQAVEGVSSLHRGAIWAALLNVRDGYQQDYDWSAVSTPHELDRQLEVDVPRCHQYSELLASRLGQRKLFRVLKAWVINEADKDSACVYWQGLDSLFAPFLVLNFTDESLALASFSRFLQRYCAGSYINDNSDMLQVTMRTFEGLLEFHDAELSLYFKSLNLSCELYTMSWFMTKFTHILHLDKIFQLWDLFLVNPPFFFLLVGLAAIYQKRLELLKMDFNRAMTTLSSIADDLDFNRLLQDARLLSAKTPTSFFAPFLKTTAKHAINSEVHLLNLTFPQILASPLCQADWSLNRVLEHEIATLLPFSLVFDLRPLEEFKLAHIPNSVSITALDAPLAFKAVESVLSGLDKRAPYILVYGKEKAARELATVLVSSKISRVLYFCTEHEAALKEHFHTCTWTISTTISDEGDNSMMIKKCRGTSADVT